MKDGPCFIYLHAKTGTAWPQTARAEGGHCELLFTCPESWLPKTQAEFEQAARYYDVTKPQLIQYNGDLVPF